MKNFSDEARKFSLGAIFLTAGLLVAQAVFAQANPPAGVPASRGADGIPTALQPLAAGLGGCNSQTACEVEFNRRFNENPNATLSLLETKAPEFLAKNDEARKIADDFKSQVIAKLSSAQNQGEVAETIIQIAEKLVRDDPVVAKRLGVNSNAVQAAKTIVTEVKKEGVDLSVCRKPEEELSDAELGACMRVARKLAQNKETANSVRQYLPEIAKVGNTLDPVIKLQEALAAGKYQELGTTDPQKAGEICLAPGSPAVCDQIAKDIFGSEGVAELARVRAQVSSAGDQYRKRAEGLTLTTPDGRHLSDPEAIHTACDNAFSKGDVELAKQCGDIAVKNGFATPEDVANGLKFLESAAGKVDVNQCRSNPAACEQFVPQEFKNEFGVMRQIGEIMRQAIGFDPSQCEQGALNPEIGQKCFEGSKRALSQIEPLATTPEAKRIVDEIKGHIQEGERMQNQQQAINQVVQSGGGPGGCETPANPVKCIVYCSQPDKAQECFYFGARQRVSGFQGNEAVRRFEQLNTGLQQAADWRGTGPQTTGVPQPGALPEGVNYPTPQATPQSFIGPSPECFAAIQGGDFAKAKQICQVPQYQPQYQPPQPYYQQPGQQPGQFPGQPGQFPGQSGQFPGQYPPGQNGAPYGYPGQTGQPGPSREQMIKDCQFGGDVLPQPTPEECAKRVDEYLRTKGPQPPPQGRTGVCPLAPTVTSCPAGQRIESRPYSSPECGSYNICVPDTNPPSTSPAPSVSGGGLDFRGGIYRDGTPWDTCMYRAGSGSDAELLRKFLLAGKIPPPWSELSSKGQQDTARCEQEAGFSQTSAPSPTSANFVRHNWGPDKNGRTVESYILSDSSLPKDVSPERYADYIKGIDANVKAGFIVNFVPNAGDSSPSNWPYFGVPAVSTIAVPTANLQTAAPCPNSVAALLSGCQWVYTDNAGNATYCNGPKTASAQLGDPAAKPGCFPPPPMTNVSQPTTGQTSGNQTMPSSQTTTGNQPTSGGTYPYTFSSTGYRAETQAAAENYCRGQAPGSGPPGVQGPYERAQAECVQRGLPWGAGSATTPYPSTGGGTCSSALQNLLGSGCHQMYWENGQQVYCDGPMSKSAKEGATTATPGCSGSGTGGGPYPGSIAGQENHIWRFKDGSSQNSQVNTGNPLIAQKNAEAANGYYAGWEDQAGNSSSPNFGIPRISSTPTTGGPYPGGGSTCPAEIAALLGSGCHDMGNWFNGPMDQYVLKGTTQVKSCASSPISGCSSGWSGGGTGGCPAGQWWNGSACVTSTGGTGGGTSCSSGQYWYVPPGGGAGYCTSSGGGTGGCSSGQYWNGSACVSSTGGTGGSTYCAPPTYWNGTNCASAGSPPPGGCTSGQYWNGSTCVNSTTCSSGQYWNGTSCVATSPTDCTSGQYWNGTSCVSSTSGGGTGGGTSCTSGQYWNGTACVTSGTYTDPSTGCTNAGGTWNSSTNYCQMPNSSTGSGGSYTPPPSGGYSSDPATGCAQAGGTWNSTTNYCQMPGSTPPPSSYFSGPCPANHLWNGSFCISQRQVTDQYFAETISTLRQLGDLLSRIFFRR